METKTYNRSNFHNHTFCLFTEVGLAEINGRNPDFKSKSGSSYYFTDAGVYRLSNHWSRVANCRWRLESNLPNTSRTKLGFALWSSFHRDNESEKLYLVTVDYQTRQPPISTRPLLKIRMPYREPLPRHPKSSGRSAIFLRPIPGQNTTVAIWNLYVKKLLKNFGLPIRRSSKSKEIYNPFSLFSKPLSQKQQPMARTPNSPITNQFA